MFNNLLSVFPSVKKATLKKELKDLLNDIINQINKINQNQDPLDRIIDFFNLMSVYHDLNYELDKYSKVLSEEDLSLLKGNIAYMGRTDSGMNRTSKGEIVTEHNVWLGNVYGLFTFPISSWKEKKDTPPGCWGWSNIYGIDSEKLSPYNVVSLQAKFYVENNILHLKKVFQYIIDNLEK